MSEDRIKGIEEIKTLKKELRPCNSFLLNLSFLHLTFFLTPHKYSAGCKSCRGACCNDDINRRHITVSCMRH